MLLNKKIPPNQSRSLELSVSGAVNENDRTVEISFSSEQPVERWFGCEILSHDANAIDFTRLLEVGVVLFAHGRDVNHGVMPIGTIENAWLDESDYKGRAVIKFDEDEHSEKVFQKVKNGTIKGVSFGYSVSEWLEIKAGHTSDNGRFTGPVFVGTKWEPYEISIEPIPADSKVGINRTADTLCPPPVNDKENNKNRTNNKEESELTEQEILQNERTRIAEITALCRTHDLSPDTYITEGQSVDAVRQIVLDELVKRKAPQTPNVEVTRDEADKFRMAATDGLLLRAGLSISKPADGASDFKGMRLRDLAVDCLVRAGVADAYRFGDAELLKRAYTADGALQSILSNAANKSLSQHYAEVETTFQHWTGKDNVSDFKQAEYYRIGEAGELEKVAQNGVIPHDSDPKDEKVYKSVATYAKQWGFTRQALINDDLGALNKMPALYAQAAKRGINKLVYKSLTGNPAIFDGKVLFGSDHKNMGIAAEISTDSISEARKAMRTQKNIKGDATLNIAPKYLLVPANLETRARQFINSDADPAAAHSGVANVFRNSMDIIVDAELDAVSQTAWYLAASPNAADTIVVSYLNGNETPTLEVDTDFDVLGLKFRIYIDYGVTIADFRGLHKNEGAN